MLIQTYDECGHTKELCEPDTIEKLGAAEVLPGFVRVRLHYCGGPGSHIEIVKQEDLIQLH